MPPFQYDPNVGGAPLVGSIADLIQRGGLIRAQAATAAAQANAWAQAQKASIWGNTIQNIASIPSQIQAQRVADQEAQMKTALVGLQGMKLQSELQEQQRQRSDVHLGDAAVRELAPQFQQTDPITGTSRLDLSGLTSALRKRGVGEDYINTFAERAAKGIEANDKVVAAQRQQAHAVADQLADAAHTGTDADSYFRALDAKVQAQLISPDIAQRARGLFGTYQGDYDTFKNEQSQLSPTMQKHWADLDKELAEAQEKRATATKAEAEAANLKEYGRTTPGTPQEQYLQAVVKGDTAKAAQMLKVIGDVANATRDPAQQALARELAGLRVDEAKKKLQELDEKKVKQQEAMEDKYRAALRTSMSSRSGTIGTEDAKVGIANHLLGLLEQSYDPASGKYNVSVPNYSELALGLARMLSPTGTVGVEMEKELKQATALGDINKKLSYILGSPLNGTTQDILQNLKDSIERQGTIAMKNRAKSLKYLRDTTRPTDLDQSRADTIESAAMPPLRLSRVVRDTNTGKTRTRVSYDGGKTWAWDEE